MSIKGQVVRQDWRSLELFLVIGLLLFSLGVGTTLAVTAYTHGFTALPNAANGVGAAHGR